ncbi:3-mercaptopyruvate sulfurtransferase [Kocuria flava]|uniref:Sulfurtransferase n=1 Tax=Kocuria flava TaxID=446860 RepID=A0A0U3G820_9MICC|nr:sulfurtransferase [Kocuria flava]ALU39243.1 3-mercaptopyruvate sulfurtransferase [Kocuria flava]GEO91290.1 sulfurtransferase [Kocuria flava]
MDPRTAADTAAPLEPPGPVVTTAWLAEHLHDPRLVLVDASSVLNRTEEAIPGALLLDLDGPFSDSSADLPHTLPPAEQLSAAARGLGISGTSTVVAYDARGIFASARVWWLLRAAGFDRVAVLDGGLPAWTAEGRPTAAHAAPPAEPGDVELTARPGFFADAEDVARALRDPAATVLDARSAGRFAGTEPEPRPGLRPGHMPGAVNLPYTRLQGPDGRLLPLPELRARLAACAPEGHRLVTTCGSGLTACVLALGAHLTGRDDVRVYDGSWAEWGRPGPRPVVGPDGS